MNKKHLLWAVALAAAAAAGGWAWQRSRAGQLPEGLAGSNGRLEVERIEIATKYPGRIAELPVAEGDGVRKGQVVARLDMADVQAQLAAAEAARLRATTAMGRAQAETGVRQVQLRLAEQELAHAQSLRRQQLVSAAELERRQAQRDGEAAGVAVARAAIAEAQAAREEASAQIHRLEVARDDMTLRAPVSGRIEYRVVQAGSVLPAGGRVATLLDVSDLSMTVFFPMSVAGRLQLGDEARIVLDAAPRYVIPARVSFVAAEAQFTPKYVETRSERDKLMYRVKLKVPAPLALRWGAFVKPGLTGDGYVRTTPSVPWPAAFAVRLPPAPAAPDAAGSAASAASAR